MASKLIDAPYILSVKFSRLNNVKLNASDELFLLSVRHQ